MLEVSVRPMREEEYPLLKKFLYLALYVHKGEDPFPEDIIYKPELKIYYEEFGKKDDTCLVAEVDAKVIGAVWARIMHDYGYVDDETPSLSLSLVPEYRGRGIGTRLLLSAINVLRDKGYRQVSLSSQKENFSCAMYFKAGFTVHHEDEEEYVMVKDLTSL